MARGSDMKLIIEYDGDCWTAVAVEVGRAGHVIVDMCSADASAVPPPLFDDEVVSGILPTELVEWMQEKGFHELDALVVAEDRQLVRFDIALPRMSKAQLAALLEREGRRHCNVGPEQPVFIGWRSCGRSDDGRRAYSVLVSPHDGLARELARERSVRVVSLVDRGEAILSALPKNAPERLLVIDASSKDIRFVFLESGVTKNERRIHATNPADPGTGALSGTLDIELPRTLDYLAELGFEPPEAIAFPSSLGINRDVMEQLAGELTVVEVSGRSAQALAESADGPGVGVVGAVKHLTGDVRLTEISFVRPEVPGRTRLAAAVMIVLVGVWGLLEGLTARDAQASFAAEVGQLEIEIDELDAAATWQVDEATADDTEFPHIKGLLSGRRSASRLLAEVCNRVPPEVHLLAVSFDETDSVVVEGFVVAPSNLEAVRALALFREELARLEFLEDIGERVRYGDGVDVGQVVNFTLGGRWAR